MRKRTLILIILSMGISGCAINQSIEQANIPEKTQLCIIENPAVRDGFLLEYKSVLTSKQIPYKVVSKSTVPESCEWTSTYTANWTWDLAMYMSYAEIKVFHNGALDGEAIYDSTRGGANMSKFIDAETKIRELVDKLMQFKMSSLFGLYYS